MDLDIKVILFDGKPLNIKAESNDTIDYVKQKIQDQNGMNPDFQRLFYSKYELEEGRTLGDYNVQDREILFLFTDRGRWRKEKLLYNSAPQLHRARYLQLQDEEEMRKGIMLLASNIMTDLSRTFRLRLKEVKEENKKAIDDLTLRVNAFEDRCKSIEDEAKKLCGRVSKVEERVDELSKHYYEHTDKHHTLKIDLVSISCSSSDIYEKIGQQDSFSCFEGAKGEFELTFQVISGELPGGVMDFSELKIEVNGVPIKIEELEFNPRSVAFELEFPKEGEFEIAIQYQNVKRSIAVSVSSRTMCPEKTEIMLRKKCGEDRSQNEFKVGEEIEVVIAFKNVEGLSLPFICFGERDFVLHVTPVDSLKAMKKVFMEFEEDNLEDGKILGCSFKMKKHGEYRARVFDSEFGITEVFSIVL